MLYVIVFAVTLVVSQLVAGLIVLGLYTNPRIMKWIYKRTFKMMSELEEDMD